MESSQLVLKRLQDLKKLSLDLKLRTEQNANPDPQILRTILHITKSLSTSNSAASLQDFTKQMRQQRGLTPSPSAPVGILEQPLWQSEQQQTGDFQLRRDESSCHLQKHYQSNVSSLLQKNQQIKQLKQNNERLLHRIEQLETQLEETKLKHEQQIQNLLETHKKQLQFQDSKSSSDYQCPYFKLDQLLDTFSTKMSIQPSEYPKIEYLPYTVKLHLDKLTLQKPYKEIKKQSKIQSQNSLFLGDIFDVEYLEGNRMILCFGQGKGERKEEGERVRVFLQFDSPQSLHRWDLGIYINSKIVTAMYADKLFLRDPQGKATDKEQERQREGDKERERENRLREEQEKVREQRRRVEEEEKRMEEERRRKQEEDRRRKIEEERKREEIKKMEDERKRQQQKKIEQQKRKEDQRKKEEERKKQLHKKQIEKAIQFLQNGVQVIKYSQGGIKGHQKRIFLSSDLENLCWQNKDSPNSKPKQLPLSEIKSIEKSGYGPGVQKHVGKSKITDINCFMVIHTKSKDFKNLQLKLETPQQMQQFSQKLILFLHQSRQNQIQLSKFKENE